MGVWARLICRYMEFSRFLLLFGGDGERSSSASSLSGFRRVRSRLKRGEERTWEPVWALDCFEREPGASLKRYHTI